MDKKILFFLRSFEKTKNPEDAVKLANALLKINQETISIWAVRHCWNEEPFDWAYVKLYLLKGDALRQATILTKNTASRIDWIQKDPRYVKFKDFFDKEKYSTAYITASDFEMELPESFTVTELTLDV